MKKLIFLTLLAVPAISIAQTPQREMPTVEDGQAIVSQIKDIEVAQMIGETAEFKECRDKYQFDASDSPSKRTDKLKEAEKCFQDKLKNSSDPEKLRKLSEALDLKSYRLVKSNSAKEIQEYLTNKMIQALTGVDPKVKSDQEIKDSLKFQNRKQVDQSVFLQLYKTQLGKNALYEISRFCFEDLRNVNAQNSNSFYEHWQNNNDIINIQQGQQKTIDDAVASVIDTGGTKFGNFTDTSDKSKIYTEIFNSIQGNGGSSPNPQIQQFISKFFLGCGFVIEPLCSAFKNSTTTSNTSSQLDFEQKTPAAGSGSSSSKGAAACLALNRIREYKKAIANADKVAEYMEQEMQGGNNLQQFMKGLNGEPIKTFSFNDSGSTIDELTNNTASDILKGDLENQFAQDKMKECEDSPELAKCEGLVYKTEDLDRIKQRIELDQTMKREVEIARVKKLVEGNKQDLETYLKENGFFDILKSPDFKDWNKDKLVEAVGKSFEAKKLAMLNEINTRLGSRQTKDEQSLKTDKASLLPAAKQDSKEERARLAQMVLFNNIITSHLTLMKKDSSGNPTPAGRNVGAWKKEEQALDQDSVDTRLFENLKATDPNGGNGGGVGNAEIADFSLLDDILGKERTP